MSAYMVSNETICAMLEARHLGAYPGNALRYFWNNRGHSVNGREREVGQVLVDQNIDSVNYRYSKNNKAYPFRHTAFTLPSITPVQFIKLCNCYMYQACETPNWEQTEAYAIVNALRERAIRNLPGYDGAPWGL